MATDSTGSQNYADGTLRLTGQVKQSWSTPTGSVDTEKYGNGSLKLDGQAKTWPTATARDYRSGKSNITSNSRPLSEVVERCGPRVQVQTGQPSPAVSGRLNSRFVEWLMGFPEGWTDADSRSSQTGDPELRHWETLLAHLLPRWLGEFSRAA